MCCSEIIMQATLCFWASVSVCIISRLDFSLYNLQKKKSRPAFINVESSFNIMPYYTNYNTTQLKVYVNQAF